MNHVTLEVCPQGTEPGHVKSATVSDPAYLIEGPRLHDRLLRGAQRGQAHQTVANGGIQLGQEWEHGVPYARTQKAFVPVTGIDAVAIARRAHERFDLTAGAIQQRTNHRV